jgi:hypothetical protein
MMMMNWDDLTAMTNYLALSQFIPTHVFIIYHKQIVKWQAQNKHL